MPTDAKMIRVMIASPGDVPAEREIIGKVIQEWNSVNAIDRSMVLVPVAWETDSSPEMYGHPQDIISKQILRDCDLLIAVFWTRLGSRTATAASGTVQEIEEHLATGKPAMIYFSLDPVKLDSVNQEQYKALTEFKNEYKRRGLIAEYESKSGFREMLTRHLSHTIIRTFKRQEADKFGNTSVITRPPQLSLSSDAEMLLRQASEGSDGTIVMLSTLDGLNIEAAGVTFASAGSNPRDEARWRSALKELFDNALVEDRGGRGEVFQLTGRGYDKADALGSYDHEPDAPD